MADLVTPNNHFIPPHIAVFNHSSFKIDKDIVFQVAAVEKQLREHVAPLWDYAPPGMQFYEDPSQLSEDDAGLLGYVDDDGNAESAGYHTDLAGRVYGLVDLNQSRMPSGTLSHEALEMYGNARLNRTTPGPRDRIYYVELCDPCQRDYYEIEVTVMGETRRVNVADFVLPRWFDLPNRRNSDNRTTYLDRHRLSPFEVAPGGYQIAEELDGQIVFLSSVRTPEFAMNRSNHSRTNRIRLGKLKAVAAAPSAQP